MTIYTISPINIMRASHLITKPEKFQLSLKNSLIPKNLAALISNNTLFPRRDHFKMTIKEFIQNGYQIQVTYTNTQTVQADVDPNQINLDINTSAPMSIINKDTKQLQEDEDNLEFDNNNVIDTTMNDNSTTYNIIKPDGSIISCDNYELLIDNIKNL